MKTHLPYYGYYEFLFVLSVFLPIQTTGQIQVSPADTNFWQIRAAYRTAYGTLIDTDTGEGGEIAQYKRWESFWMPRLIPTGSFTIAEKAISDTFRNLQVSFNALITL